MAQGKLIIHPAGANKVTSTQFVGKLAQKSRMSEQGASQHWIDSKPAEQRDGPSFFAKFLYKRRSTPVATKDPIEL
jgi:hypothetical protein